MRDVRSNRRDHLGRAGATANDGDAFMPIVVGVIPMVGMKSLALKALLALEAWDDGLAQRPCGVDQELRVERAFAGGVHCPAFGVVVPFDAFDVRLQFHPVAQAELLHHVLRVAVQFGLFGEHLRPAIGRKGQRIQRRGHIDGGAGVSVLAPGAAEEVPTFQQTKIIDAGLEQIDRRTLAAETAADDQHLESLHGPPFFSLFVSSGIAKHSGLASCLYRGIQTAGR
ncbi:hypothetical protein D3C84_324910 [compost metagenome]